MFQANGIPAFSFGLPWRSCNSKFHSVSSRKSGSIQPQVQSYQYPSVLAQLSSCLSPSCCISSGEPSATSPCKFWISSLQKGGWISSLWKGGLWSSEVPLAEVFIWEGVREKVSQSTTSSLARNHHSSHENTGASAWAAGPHDISGAHSVAQIDPPVGAPGVWLIGVMDFWIFHPSALIIFCCA